jgi:hypothetical protein
MLNYVKFTLSLFKQVIPLCLMLFLYAFYLALMPRNQCLRAT